jgi:hypothetical protein
MFLVQGLHTYAAADILTSGDDTKIFKLHPVCLLKWDVESGHPSFPVVWERQSEVIIGSGEMCN